METKNNSLQRFIMSEGDGVEVCQVCQEIFLEEAALMSHMKEMHLDVDQCKSEGDREERYSTVVAQLEKQKKTATLGPVKVLAESFTSIPGGSQAVSK